MTALYQMYGLDELLHREARMAEHLYTLVVAASNIGGVLVHV
jgi:hypothetical protein